MIRGWDVPVVGVQGGNRSLLSSDGKLLEHLGCEFHPYFSNLVCNSAQILFQHAILLVTKSGRCA